MNTAHWPQIESLFDSLLDMPESVRTEQLRSAVTEYPRQLIEEVKGLLAGVAEDSEFLNDPAKVAEPALRAFDDGDSVGPWEIVAVLGVGGQGQVYRVQRQFDQDGALKILPAPADHSEPALARPRAEGLTNGKRSASFDQLSQVSTRYPDDHHMHQLVQDVRGLVGP